MKLVLVSLLIVGLFIAADDIARGQVPSIRTFTALILLAVILAIVNDVAPEIAKALAVLIALSVVLVRGPRVLQLVGGFRGGGG